MEKMNIYRIRLGISLILNVVLAAVMPEIVRYAYIQRAGELHFGGEWLLLWLMVIVAAYMFFEKKGE